MYTSPVQTDRGFSEFHKGQRGRKHLFGARSSVDSIVFGHDIDSSGQDPHGAFMNRFGDHAGSRSAEKPQRPFRKPLHAMASTVDSVVFGHDLDGSGPAPHEATFSSFKASGHGGVQAGTTPYRPFRKPGYAMKSTMDDLIYGRDIDMSGEDPHEKLVNTYRGHAGVVSSNRSPRPFRKQNCSSQSQMDEVIYGRDMDQSGPSPQKEYMMKNFKDHAGMKSEEKVVRPFRKPGIRNLAEVDDVMQEHDVDGSGPNVQAQHFTSKYSGHAGAISGECGSPAARRVGRIPLSARPAGQPTPGAVCPRAAALRQALEERPRWNASTNSKAKSGLGFAPSPRPASEAGASEAGSSVAGSFAGSRTLRPEMLAKSAPQLPAVEEAASAAAAH